MGNKRNIKMADLVRHTPIKVKIKTWENMVKDYPINSYGDISIPATFEKEMEKLVPEDRVIEIRDPYIEEWKNWVKGDLVIRDVVFWRWGNYAVSEDMIEEFL